MGSLVDAARAISAEVTRFCCAADRCKRRDDVYGRSAKEEGSARERTLSGN